MRYPQGLQALRRFVSPLQVHLGILEGPKHYARSVTEVFEWLYNVLGREQYCRLLPIIRTDRGSEFTNPVSIECTKFGAGFSTVIHSVLIRRAAVRLPIKFIRRVLPKGRSFDHLQKSNILRMMSRISFYRERS